MDFKGKGSGGKKGGKKEHRTCIKKTPVRTGAGKGANVTFDGDDYVDEDVFDEEDYDANVADTMPELAGHDTWVTEHEGEPPQQPWVYHCDGCWVEIPSWNEAWQCEYCHSWFCEWCVDPPRRHRCGACFIHPSTAPSRMKWHRVRLPSWLFVSFWSP